MAADLGARYVVNGESQYLREGSITDGPGGAISFTPIQTETNFFTFHLGASVGLPYRQDVPPAPRRGR